MIKRLAYIGVAVALMLGISATVSSAKVPIVGTDSVCAASVSDLFTEDASACGGPGYEVLGCWSYWTGHSWVGNYTIRYYQNGLIAVSWWESSSNLC
jgi:hypothetical protein